MASNNVIENEILLNKSKSLLEKYEIPVNHLDFGYINKTTNYKELEKIVLILRSGQEGYYPDLTKCAEAKLHELRPESKILRTEENILTKNCMTKDQWNSFSNDIKNWETNVKQIDTSLREIRNGDNDKLKGFDCENYPPIRKFKGKINNMQKEYGPAPKPSSRIRACDYDKWSKYDAGIAEFSYKLNTEISMPKEDTVILKMDLDEERNQEIVEQKNKLNSQNIKLIEEISNQQNHSDLTEAELNFHSNRHRERGNEFFKAKEFSDALNEYTKSINFKKTAAGYNNRAMAYLKLNLYKNAVIDCDNCLKIDPYNIKALLRKAQALYSNGSRRDAFYVYEEVITLDPENKIAQNQVNEIKQQLPDLAAGNSFRMKIEESIEVINEETPRKIENNIGLIEQNNDGNIEEQTIDVDFSKLIIPNKIIKNKLPEAMKALGEFRKDQTQKLRDVAHKRMEDTKKEITLSSANTENKRSGTYIEELN